MGHIGGLNIGKTNNLAFRTVFSRGAPGPMRAGLSATSEIEGDAFDLRTLHPSAFRVLVS